MSKWKLNNCPTCEGKKSKSAISCMMCFRKGLGTQKQKGKSPRFDKELRQSLKEKFAELKKEQGIKL